MMNSSTIVSRDLEHARQNLHDAHSHLGHMVKAGSDARFALDHNTDELALAIHAVAGAIAAVAASVERLAELPVCDGGHSD
jgi:hypothetical protein